MRLAQVSTNSPTSYEFFLTDALGSVRQMVDETGTLTLAQAYLPYGEMLSRAGSGMTSYGFTGEATDESGVNYLRARYYSTQQGRFITKDPSRMEPNLYLYARANPINLIDPTGLFSRSQVAQTFGEMSFDAVLTQQLTNGKHWGLIAALLKALPGDTISAGKLAIGLTFPVPQVAYQTYKVGYDSNKGITFNGFPWLSSSDTLPTILPVWTPGWRGDGSPRYYKIADSSSSMEYIDGLGYTDLPDIWGYSGAISIWPFLSPLSSGVQGAWMVDRFGNKYFAAGGAISFGLPGEFAYFESYVGKISRGSHNLLSETELRKLMIGPGLCISGQVGVIAGRSAGGCFNSSYFINYSVGIQLGISVNATVYTIDLGKDSSLAWDWAIQDQLRGISMNDLKTMDEVPYLVCNQYLPMIIR